MAYSVDTLISNLAAQAESYRSYAGSLASDAKAFANGTAIEVSPTFTEYVQKPTVTTLDAGLSGSVSGTQTIAGLRADLEHYFNEFFPDISADYTVWIGLLTNAVNTGVPLTLDNHVANRQAQVMGEAEGIRIQRKFRAGWAGKGYSLVPGMMVAMVLDESDERTEKLISSAIGAANQAIEEVLAGYKAIIAASIATSDARVAAINAMSELIQVSAAMYSAKSDAIAALYRTRSSAAEAVIALYNAELKVDEINASLYGKNAQINTQTYEKTVQMYLRNEKFQVQAALAGAEVAGKVAQAAFSALNTIVGSSTASFA